jgi:hypothetical protein
MNKLPLKFVVMGMFHAGGVTGDSVSVKCWLPTLECLFLISITLFGYER